VSTKKKAHTIKTKNAELENMSKYWGWLKSCITKEVFFILFVVIYLPNANIDEYLEQVMGPQIKTSLLHIFQEEEWCHIQIMDQSLSFYHKEINVFNKPKVLACQKEVDISSILLSTSSLGSKTGFLKIAAMIKLQIVLQLVAFTVPGIWWIGAGRIKPKSSRN